MTTPIWIVLRGWTTLGKRFLQLLGENYEMFKLGEITIDKLNCLYIAGIYLGPAEQTYQD